MQIDPRDLWFLKLVIPCKNRASGQTAIFTVQTPGEAIVKRLTAERMTKIRDQLAREGEEIKKLEAEVELLSGKDDVSDEMLDQIQAE